MSLILVYAWFIGNAGFGSLRSFSTFSSYLSQGQRDQNPHRILNGLYLLKNINRINLYTKDQQQRFVLFCTSGTRCEQMPLKQSETEEYSSWYCVLVRVLLELTGIR